MKKDIFHFLIYPALVFAFLFLVNLCFAEESPKKAVASSSKVSQADLLRLERDKAKMDLEQVKFEIAQRPWVEDMADTLKKYGIDVADVLQGKVTIDRDGTVRRPKPETKAPVTKPEPKPDVDALQVPGAPPKKKK